MNNENLPAYPVMKIDEDGRLYFDKRDSGLTKLEALTMAAMQAIIPISGIDTYHASNNIEDRCGDIARAAVSIALATLSELSKRNKE